MKTTYKRVQKLIIS